MKHFDQSIKIDRGTLKHVIDLLTVCWLLVKNKVTYDATIFENILNLYSKKTLILACGTRVLTEKIKGHEAGSSSLVYSPDGRTYRA